MILVTRLLFWADGFAVSPSLMLLHPRSKQDAGLIEHERVHQRQMRADGWLLFIVRYLFSRRWRTLYEVEAYRVSIAGGMSRRRAAHYLATSYWLRLTQEQAEQLLETS